MSRFDKPDEMYGFDREPRVSVQLTGTDGNAFSIVARVAKAMRRAGCSRAYIEAYKAEATSGDYDHLLMTTMRFVDVD